MNVSWTKAWPFLFVHFCPPQPSPPPPLTCTGTQLPVSPPPPISSVVACYYIYLLYTYYIIIIYYYITLRYVYCSGRRYNNIVCVFLLRRFFFFHCYVTLFLSSFSYFFLLKRVLFVPFSHIPRLTNCSRLYTMWHAAARSLLPATSFIEYSRMINANADRNLCQNSYFASNFYRTTNHLHPQPVNRPQTPITKFFQIENFT